MVLARHPALVTSKLDTITDARKPAAQALPGFKLVQPVGFGYREGDLVKMRDE